MRFSSEEIISTAQSTGFRPEMVEKVLYLLSLLNTLNSHPYLKGKLILKGGTAVNLFFLNVPRLSVDIDLNYVGTLDREAMLLDRPKIDQAMQAVFSREGFNVKRMPDEHAGGKWHLNYQSFTGQSSNIEVDLNFMYRLPLWDVQNLDSCPLGNFQAKNIPVLDIHELAAGKLSALMSRRQARDMFDCQRILSMTGLIPERLRIAFVVYGAMNRKDWRTVKIEDVDFDAKDLSRQLIPTLQFGGMEEKGSVSVYGTQLVNDCRKALSMVLPFTETEIEFLSHLLDKGEILPEHLTTDQALQERIRQQPLLQWKAMHVRQHKGVPE